MGTKTGHKEGSKKARVRTRVAVRDWWTADVSGRFEFIRGLDCVADKWHLNFGKEGLYFLPTPRRRIYFKLRANSKIDFCLMITFYAYAYSLCNVEIIWENSEGTAKPQANLTWYITRSRLYIVSRCLSPSIMWTERYIYPNTHTYTLTQITRRL